MNILHGKETVKIPISSSSELMRLIFMLDSYDETHLFSTDYRSFPSYAVYVPEHSKWQMAGDSYVKSKSFTEFSIEGLAYLFDHDMFVKDMNFRNIATVIYTYEDYVQVCATKRWSIMSSQEFIRITETYGAIAAYMDNSTFLFDRVAIAKKYKTLVSINELLRVAKMHEHFQTDDGYYIYDGDAYHVVDEGEVVVYNSIQYAKTTENKCFIKRENALNYLIGIWGTVRE